jgi:hypothetical protein
MLTAFDLSERQTFFRYRGVHQQSKRFALRNPQLRPPQAPTGLAEFVSDDFPISFHGCFPRRVLGKMDRRVMDLQSQTEFSKSE